MVGGIIPFIRVNTTPIDSTAPPAVIMCPYIDLWALIGILYALSPKTNLMALVSVTSFSLVLVPWALM